MIPKSFRSVGWCWNRNHITIFCLLYECSVCSLNKKQFCSRAILSYFSPAIFSRALKLWPGAFSEIPHMHEALSMGSSTIPEVKSARSSKVVAYSKALQYAEVHPYRMIHMKIFFLLKTQHIGGAIDGWEINSQREKF